MLGGAGDNFIKRLAVRLALSGFNNRMCAMNRSSPAMLLAIVLAGGFARLAHAADAESPAPEARYDDHQNMMDQLGIRRLHDRRAKNPAIYDEAAANRYKDSLPDVLTLRDGTKVTRPDQWPKRRAEIVEDFEREVYGRIPAYVPRVVWEVTATTDGQSGDTPTVTKTLVGRVNNSAAPQISVNIRASFTVPAGAKQSVPLMLVFSFGGFGGRGFRGGSATKPWTQQAIEHGWGYGTIDPASIQPDNNQLRTGIIGLTNLGRPRKPDGWGALRAWQWGVSRLIDYFAAHPEAKVDATKIGIEGAIRAYGKAAMVTERLRRGGLPVGLKSRRPAKGATKLHRCMCSARPSRT